MLLIVCGACFQCVGSDPRVAESAWLSQILVRLQVWGCGSSGVRARSLMVCAVQIVLLLWFALTLLLAFVVAALSVSEVNAHTKARKIVRQVQSRWALTLTPASTLTRP